MSSCIKFGPQTDYDTYYPRDPLLSLALSM